MKPTILFGACLCGYAFTAVNTQAQDLLAPTLVGVSRTPSAIDTTSGDAQVDLSFEITDDLSGFGAGFISYHSPSGSLTESAFFSSSASASGDALNGVFEATLNFDQFTEAGIWQPVTLSVNDAVGNTQFLNAQQIADLGFDLAISVNVVPEPGAGLLILLASSALLRRSR